MEKVKPADPSAAPAKRTACVVCRVRYVDDSEFCDDCTDFKPIEIWLQSPPQASTNRGAENYDRFLVIHENGIKYMKCDRCSFICRPLVDVFSKHYSQHSSSGGAVDGAANQASAMPTADNLDAAILVKCTKCDASFPDDAKLSAHYEIHATRKLACKVCNRTFKTKIKLQIHKRKHSTKVTTSTIKCGMCDKEFKTKSGYNHHRANVCVEYRCDLCQQIFLVKALLNAHLKKEHDVDVQEEEAAEKKARQSCVCSVCGKRINESALSRHMQLHSEQKPYQCDMCGKQFRIKWSLREHIMIEIGMKDYVCEVCGKKFVIQAYLNKHMRVHLMCEGKFEGFQCEMCGKKFAEEWRVKEHQRNTHRAEKARQYGCDLCDRKFERKWLVRSHKRAAHEEFLEEYHCEHCTKKFTEKWMIKLHLQTLHAAQPISRSAPTAAEVAQPGSVLASSHVAQKLLEYNKMIAGDEGKVTKASATAPKKFECELCGKTFATKQGMKNHVYAELNMRKYVCEICGKRYNWWMGLKEHSIMSHGTKEFSCRLCSKEFPTKKRFKDHMTVHSEDRPYNCECGNAFKLKRYLKKHQKRCCSLKVERKPAIL